MTTQKKSILSALGPAVALIAAKTADVFFVHLPGVDLAGHASGWGSRAQLAAVTVADAAVGRLLAEFASRGLLDDTAVLVTSDHGGAGMNHGPDDPRSRFIPWILAGPGIRQDFDLTAIADLEVHTEDTFATLALILGLRTEERLDGKVITAALDPRYSKVALR